MNIILEKKDIELTLIRPAFVSDKSAIEKNLINAWPNNSFGRIRKIYC